MTKRDDSYKFKFHILDNYPSVIDEAGTKEIRVATTIKDMEQHTLYEGNIKVKFNQFGVFPSIQDVAKAVSNSTVRRLLMSELKRYVKPHRKFL
ncbi:diaminopimelate epimerase [Bacillus songklensis]|uniref:Diaminopimelate epimerase n=1 Tax=Bacillus songklensis TaxID=1069116 RepID=A0ABV8B435_9BACI